MVLIDTNIVSEIMSRSPSSNVVNWLNNQDSLSLFISTISIAEVNYGLNIMPDGKRKNVLTDRFNSFVSKAFEQRIIDFNESAAIQYANIMSHRKIIGRPMSVPDGQIAAIALSNELAIATRNTRDFDDCGIIIVNPFDDAKN